MIEYSLGIMESEMGVVLIRKTKPDWQAGKYNFVGGKVEPREDPLRCMVREFKEETGVTTTMEDWNFVGWMKREDDFICYVFYMKSDLAYQVDTQEEEEIVLASKEVFLHDPDFQKDFMPNLLALYHFATSSDFTKYNASLTINYPRKD